MLGKASDFFGLDHKEVCQKASDFLDEDLNTILGKFWKGS